MPRLHRKCDVCEGSQPQALMRPILKSVEMKTAEVLSQEQVITPAAYAYVCRDCWFNFVKRKSKGELIAILETVSCDLFEFSRALEARNNRVESNESPGEDLPF